MCKEPGVLRNRFLLFQIYLSLVLYQRLIFVKNSAVLPEVQKSDNVNTFLMCGKVSYTSIIISRSTWFLTSFRNRFVVEPRVTKSLAEQYLKISNRQQSLKALILIVFISEYKNRSVTILFKISNEKTYLTVFLFL